MFHFWYLSYPDSLYFRPLSSDSVTVACTYSDIIINMFFFSYGNSTSFWLRWMQIYHDHGKYMMEHAERQMKRERHKFCLSFQSSQFIFNSLTVLNVIIAFVYHLCISYVYCTDQYLNAQFISVIVCDALQPNHWIFSIGLLSWHSCSSIVKVITFLMHAKRSGSEIGKSVFHCTQCIYLKTGIQLNWIKFRNEQNNKYMNALIQHSKCEWDIQSAIVWQCVDAMRMFDLIVVVVAFAANHQFNDTTTLTNQRMQMLRIPWHHTISA